MTLAECINPRTICELPASWPRLVMTTMNTVWWWEALMNVILGCVARCRNVFVVVRHRLFDGSDNQFDVSAQSYTSASGNTVQTALLSLENPRSHTQIPATLRRRFYEASHSRRKPFRISVVCISLQLGHEYFPPYIQCFSYNNLYLGYLTTLFQLHVIRISVRIQEILLSAF
jgi:hypothetical protein